MNAFNRDVGKCVIEHILPVDKVQKTERYNYCVHQRLGIWGTMCDFIGVTDGLTVGPDFFALKDLQTLLQPFRTQRENEPLYNSNKRSVCH
jgi:hypothetical protein